MKFFHLSDLHIGKQLHHYNLKEDQEAILREVVSYAEKERPDAILIAGDIYDKPLPSAEAVAVFDAFLTQLSELRPVIPVLLISGNHDSAQRLDYASGILSRYQIHVAGTLPKREEEMLKKVTFSDSYGEVDVYLLPFLKPSYVRQLFLENPPESYTEAVERMLKREKIDDQNRRNVLVSHQFYTGAGASPEGCDSETVTVGGLDNVDTRVVEQFDYVALGHLHSPQNVGNERIRYCGTLLKYSVSEAEHQKSITVVTLGEKGTLPQVEYLPLHPLRDVKKKRGTLEEILREAKEEERGDYISITLTDEQEPYQPKEQLRQEYERILEVKIDNTRTRNQLSEEEELPIQTDPLSVFADFYQEMQGRPMNEEEWEIMKGIYDLASGEDETKESGR